MPEDKETGRVVYHRLEGGGEAEPPAAKEKKKRAEPAVTEREVGRESLVRTLAPLLVGFALLIGLVFGLGALSVREVRTVSGRSADRERRLSETLSNLYGLRTALLRLDNEARMRDRDAPDAPGGLRPPGSLRLNNARGEVNEILRTYDRLPVAQTEKGRQLRRDIDAYVEITKDGRRYNQDGFVANRDIEKQLNALFEEVSGEREAISEERYDALARARGRIDFLKWLAVLTGLGVSAATAFEVLRRFRQLRRSFVEVQRGRQFNRQMLEGMVSAVAALDSEKRLVSANASFHEIFPEARTGERLLETVKAQESAALLAEATARSVERATYHDRWTLPAAEGERVFDVYSSPLEVAGEPGQILTLVDVTEAARAERELRQREALSAVGQAAAQVAHEIKNPLGSIRLGVAMIRDMTTERDALNTIDLVERGIEHLSKITSDVTQFSRLRNLTLADADLNEILDESLELVAEKVREKDARVERHYEAGSVHGRWDADQLRQVFVNLLANAVDASPPETPVVVSTERAAARGGNGAARARTDFTRVHVVDRGQGMDEKTRRRVFEPFFTTKKRGTGLGLAIARQIVEQHGGTITVESRPGEGTRFTVELPRSPDGAAA